jgi:hypothetical protein
VSAANGRDDARVGRRGNARVQQRDDVRVLRRHDAQQRRGNNASDVLNGVIAKQAANAGFTFSGVVDEFTGHELCSGDAWLNSVTLPVHNSYHPKAAGQSGGYLPAFRSVA